MVAARPPVRDAVLLQVIEWYEVEEHGWPPFPVMCPWSPQPPPIWNGESPSRRDSSHDSQIRARLSAVEPLVGTHGARMQGYQAGLDHRWWVEVLQPADVRGHQLRCVGGEYVYDGGDHVCAEAVAAQQQIRHADGVQARWHVVAGRHLADEERVAGYLRHRSRQTTDVEHPEWNLGVEIGDGRCRHAARPHQCVHSTVGECGESLVQAVSQHVDSTNKASRLEQHLAGGRGARTAWTDRDPLSLKVCQPVRGRRITNDHLQIILVHAGHRQGCGAGWTGREV